MKQYWRVGTIRTLLSLALGTLVLGKLYYGYIPIIADWDFYGAITFGALLFLVFLGLGWVYDEKAKLWNEQIVIQTDRYPFAFVPDWRLFAADYPTMYSLLFVLRNSFDKIGLDTRRIDELVIYLTNFFEKRPGNRKDLFSSEGEAERFLMEHPILESATERKRKYSIGTRIKRWFQIWLLRLNYIQALTGLGQDVLVFAAFYVVIIFPGASEGGLVPIEYLLQGILFLSLPIFLAMVLAGWFYDRRLKLWSPQQTVNVERNPYSYLPEPRTYALTFPMFFTLISIIREIIAKEGLQTDKLDRIIEFQSEFLKLDVSRNEDMKISQKLRKDLGDVFRNMESYRSDK
jgi:hypothetical protein